MTKDGLLNNDILYQNSTYWYSTYPCL